MNLERARRYPVATFASGSTNSLRGAALLTGIDDCVVVDVGGVTTDIGVVSAGFPLRGAGAAALAGIRTSIAMPDLLSLAVGGGSIVMPGGASVGPKSIGHGRAANALIFGGRKLTVADAAVAVGRADIGDASRVAHVDRRLARRVLRAVEMQVADAVERVQLPISPLPVVAVGGGAALLPDRLPRIGAIERPPHHAVANAIGAAIPQVSGVVDQVHRLASESIETQSEAARYGAMDAAIAAGADPRSVRIVDFDCIPIPYLPGRAYRFRAKAVGDLSKYGGTP
jgi:N-methylhydantoinase A/oxoprolinase/acetone carboxylase beta subunit